MLNGITQRARQLSLKMKILKVCTTSAMLWHARVSLSQLSTPTSKSSRLILTILTLSTIAISWHNCSSNSSRNNSSNRNRQTSKAKESSRKATASRRKTRRVNRIPTANLKRATRSALKKKPARKTLRRCRKSCSELPKKRKRMKRWRSSSPRKSLRRCVASRSRNRRWNNGCVAYPTTRVACYGVNSDTNIKRRARIRTATTPGLTMRYNRGKDSRKSHLHCDRCPVTG